MRPSCHAAAIDFGSFSSSVCTLQVAGGIGQQLAKQCGMYICLGRAIGGADAMYGLRWGTAADTVVRLAPSCIRHAFRARAYPSTAGPPSSQL